MTNPIPKKIIINTEVLITKSYKFKFDFNSTHDDTFDFTVKPITNRLVVLHVTRTDVDQHTWGQHLQVRWRLVNQAGTTVETGQVKVGDQNRQHSLAVLPIECQGFKLEEGDPSFNIVTPFSKMGQFKLYPQTKTKLYLITEYTPTSIPNGSVVKWIYYHNVGVGPVMTTQIDLTQPHILVKLNPALINQLPPKTTPDINQDTPSIPNDEDPKLTFDLNGPVIRQFSLSCEWLEYNNDEIGDWIHSYTQINRWTYRLNLNLAKLNPATCSPGQVVVKIYQQAISQDTVIQCLTKGYHNVSDYNQLIERNWGIYQNVNSLLRTEVPLMIFHEGNIDYNHQLHIHKYQHNAVVDFIDISVNCFQPPGVSEDKMAKNWVGNWLGYKHMCMFHACQIWQYLKPYSIAMRVDEDCILKENIPTIFNYFNEKRLIHLGAPMTEWHMETLDTLPVFAEEFCQTRRVTPINTPMINNKSIFSNVYVTRVGFWLGRGPQIFLREIIRSHQLYIYRWGDLPIHNVVLNMFAPHTKICTDYPTLRYYHGSWGTEHP